jgi:5-methylcytosine-specific restriction endonuclease McrA
MTMTEQKLQKLSDNYQQQKQTGWYLCRLVGLPAMTSHGKFDRVVRTYGFRCAICNVINPSLSVNHIKPKSRGGESDIDNMQILCLTDHRKKDNKLKKVKVRKDINSVFLCD